MTFRTAALIAGFVTLVLGAGYLVAGPLLLARWDLDPSESALLLGRRIGALYLGLAIMFFSAKSAPRSIGRSALSIGTAAACCLLAVLGVSEFLAQRAAGGILISAGLEVFIAAMFLITWLADRKAGRVDAGAAPTAPPRVTVAAGR